MEISCLKRIQRRPLTFSPRQRTLVTLATVCRGVTWLETALGMLTTPWEHSMELPQPVNVSGGTGTDSYHGMRKFITFVL